jgi:hypothetical protein
MPVSIFEGSRVKPDRDHVWVVPTDQGVVVMEGLLHRNDDGEWEPTRMKQPGIIELGEAKRMPMAEFILTEGGARVFLQMLANRPPD